MGDLGAGVPPGEGTTGTAFSSDEASACDSTGTVGSPILSPSGLMSRRS
jgi:hypothetical protein